MKKIILFTAIIISGLFTQISAQCGYQILSGITAGFQYEGYDAKGLNNYISVYNSRRTNTLTQKMGEFGKGTGFYIGIRPFSFVFEEELLFHTDFSISFVRETNTAKAGVDTREYSLLMTHKNFGFATALLLGDQLLLNVLNLNLTWTSVSFKNSLTSSTAGNSSQELKNDGDALGVSFESGFEFYMTEFLMVEAAAGYHLWSQPRIKFSNGSFLQVSEVDNSAMNNFIDGGGFTFRAGIMLRTNIMGCLDF